MFANTRLAGLAVAAFAASLANAQIRIDTTSLPAATEGTYYNVQLQASGGGGAYSWAVGAGALPDGITLGASNGLLSGTAVVPGVFPVTITVTGAGPSTAASRDFVLTVNRPVADVCDASLNLIVNGGFEAPTVAGVPWDVFSPSKSNIGWSSYWVSQITTYQGLTRPSEALIEIDRTYPGITPAQGLQSAELDSAWLSPLGPSQDGVPASTGIYQDIPTIAGRVYTVSYYFAARPGRPYSDNVLGVYANGSAIATHAASSNDPSQTVWSRYTTTFTANSSLTRVEFRDLGVPNGYGTLLDGVSLSCNSNPEASLKIVTESPLPPGAVTVRYSFPLAASLSGITGQPVWRIVDGALPAGMTLGADGLLSGVPAQAGSYRVTIGASASQGEVTYSDQRVFTLVIAPLITPGQNTLPDAIQAVPYSAILRASGGSGSYAWNLSSGSLPPGLTMNSSGVVGGTPLAAGSYTFSIVVADTGVLTPPPPAAQSLTLVVRPALQITTPSPLPTATTGQAYSAQFQATGGGTSLQWSLAGGPLPTGLALTPAGLLSGNPSAAGQFTLTVSVTSSVNGIAVTDQRAFALTVNTPPLAIVSELPAGVQGISHSQQLRATGGSQRYGWSISSGALPPGLTLTGDRISGTPSQIGRFAFTVTVTDAGVVGVPGQASLSTAIVINQNLKITSPPALPGAGVNSPYSYQLTATGGAQPYFWFQTSGSLPPGLSLGQTGVISGTLTDFGAFTFTISVSSTLNGVQLTDQQTFTFVADTVSLQVATTTLPAGVPNIGYLAQLSAGGGRAPYSWSATGTLPPGLELSSSGQIKGIPTAEGTYNFTVQVSDDRGQSASKPLAITIAYRVISLSADLPGGSVGSRYTGSIVASGGDGKLSFSITAGSLPPGLSLSAGAISGTPTAAGTFVFSIRVADTSGKSAESSYSIVITNPRITITPSSLASGTAGVSYSASVGASGGVAPYTFSASGLPSGLSMTPAGVISGTPAAAGSYSVSVTVVDGNGVTVTGTTTLLIRSAALTVAGDPIPTGFTDTEFTTRIPVSGGTPPYRCSVTGGSLPAGVTLGADCTISGKPTVPGTTSATVTVTDNSGTTVTQTVTITILAPAIVIAGSPAGGTVGSPYSTTLTATGGAGVLTWSGGTGLPGGLTLGGNGVVSGTSLTPGTFNFSVTAQDKYGTTASKQFSVTFTLPAAPATAFSGVGSSASPATQPSVTLRLGTAYPIDITGVLTLTFRGDDGSDDPVVRFSAGGRTVGFTIPANSLTPVFQSQGAALSTGTTAGVITLTATFKAAEQDITPRPAPTQQIRIDALPPVIQTVRATRSGSTITVVVTGFATSKQMNSAAFVFSPSAGGNFQSATLNVTVDQLFASYYSGSTSAGVGSQFVFTQTFNVTGDAAAVGSVAVTMSNARGVGNTQSANIQ